MRITKNHMLSLNLPSTILSVFATIANGDVSVKPKRKEENIKQKKFGV